MRPPVVVSRRVVGTLLDPGGGMTGARVRVGLSWSPADPFAVALSFATTSGPVWWLVSRELLAQGLGGPAGLGDVSVLPDLHDDGRVELVLSSPAGGRAGVRVSRAALGGFLAATHRVVPPGAEVLDVPDPALRRALW